MDNSDIQIQLKNVIAAIRTAENKWNTYFGYESQYEVEFIEDKEEYVINYIQKAYLSLLTFLDIHQFSQLASYLTSKWSKYSSNLLDSDIYINNGEPYVHAIEILWDITNSINSVLSYGSKENETKELTTVKSVLEKIELSAFRLGAKVNNEADLDKLAEAILSPLYPDLESNPAVMPGQSFRSPDSAIFSLKLLIEYKFISDKKNIRKILDEMQADIRNYAQSPWEYLIFLIAQTNNSITKEILDSVLLKEPSSFKSLDTILVKF